MILEPKAGLVIRYDFLWKENQSAGVHYGFKDRPCAIILVIKSHEDESRRVVVCPVTHSPSDDDNAVEIPARVASHMGLDSTKMWIKTDIINQFTWQKDMIPIGIVPTMSGEWSYGMLPDKIMKKVIKQVTKNSQGRALDQVNRDE